MREPSAGIFRGCLRLKCPPEGRPEPTLPRHGGQRTPARWLELVTGIPRGHCICLGDDPAGKQPEPRIFDHAVEVPGSIQPVARLVVLLQLPLLDLLPAPPAGRPMKSVPSLK